MPTATRSCEPLCTSAPDPVPFQVGRRCRRHRGRGKVGITESTIDTSSSADQTTIGKGEATLGDDIVAALLPARASTREVAAPPARQAWEYRTELLERGFLGWRSEQLDLRALQERLDELGQDGWELVHASWNHRV